ncbi:phosphatidylinositol phosphate synthase [Arcanobacterium hippocoleae]|uniref:Phosphatidylinositol phosphate synthase n=1 Tax=Arcanobacterium hippocoleae TaxID=149017 RepID=A0ABU1T012_9ACTO|nr:CDP-alcohol phosphatidyltransferase family protein [Arcanobacterium hippocoleae]MDR6938724.1 CDP-diacylglycerol--glycerol-3-phosphate 3-phosphatidyltransferase [Arcanobacterium hippocoleae]
MLSKTGRPFAQKFFGPFAKLFVKAGISANVVTVVGTVLSCTIVLTLIPRNQLIAGSLLTTVAILFDSLDGQIARLTGTTSEWGAFLDSTLDRIADAAVFVSVILWGYFWAAHPEREWVMLGALMALVFGSVVPYARARAEAIGKTAAVGIAERTDRLVFVGVCALLVGLGASVWVLVAGLWLLAFAALVTVIQRMYVVFQQCNQAQHNP